MPLNKIVQLNNKPVYPFLNLYFFYHCLAWTLRKYFHEVGEIFYKTLLPWIPLLYGKGWQVGIYNKRLANKRNNAIKPFRFLSFQFYNNPFAKIPLYEANILTPFLQRYIKIHKKLSPKFSTQYLVLWFYDLLDP